jgi:hypothetical protein
MSWDDKIEVAFLRRKMDGTEEITKMLAARIEGIYLQALIELENELCASTNFELLQATMTTDGRETIRSKTATQILLARYNIKEIKP